MEGKTEGRGRGGKGRRIKEGRGEGKGRGNGPCDKECRERQMKREGKEGTGGKFASIVLD